MIGLPFLHPEDHPACEDNPELFYDDTWTPSDPDVIVTRYNRRAYQDAEVLAVCGGCPFRQECLVWGVKHERWGYFGGVSENDRKELRRQWGIVLKEPNHHASSGDWVETYRKHTERRSKSAVFEMNFREIQAERNRRMNAKRTARKDEAS